MSRPDHLSSSAFPFRTAVIQGGTGGSHHIGSPNSPHFCSARCDSDGCSSHTWFTSHLTPPHLSSHQAQLWCNPRKSRPPDRPGRGPPCSSPSSSTRQSSTCGRRPAGPPTSTVWCSIPATRRSVATAPFLAWRRCLMTGIVSLSTLWRRHCQHVATDFAMRAAYGSAGTCLLRGWC